MATFGLAYPREEDLSKLVTKLKLFHLGLHLFTHCLIATIFITLLRNSTTPPMRFLFRERTLYKQIKGDVTKKIRKIRF